MRIGELAARTGVPTRLLRYYEEQGLLTPDRAANGYRDYSEELVDRVGQIRGLLDAGLPTKIIKQVLPCLANPCTIRVATAPAELIATLERERDQMDARISCLTRNRDAISDYLAAARRAPEPQPDPRPKLDPPAQADPRPKLDPPAQADPRPQPPSQAASEPTGADHSS